MKKYLLGFSFLMALPLMANAFMLYDIDFEPPAYTNGQYINGGTTRVISDNINGFITQALLLQDGGGINYEASSPYTTGVHRISWDFAVPVEQQAQELISASLVGTGTPIITTTMTSAGQSITYPGGSTAFNIAQSYSFEILMDLDANYYDFWIDGNLLNNHVGIAADADLWFVNFGQGQYMGLQAGVDNFQWEVNSAIPEPSTVSLLMFGLPSLCFAYGKFKPRKQ